MEMIIKPREGIGLINIGMSRQQVRAELATPVQTFRRYRSEIEVDYFVPLGIQVDYDRNDLCNFITALAAAKSTFQGWPIVGVPFADCRAWFEQLDSDLKVDDTGLTSRKLGINVYAPGAMQEPLDPVEAVCVFAEGYYD
jgi:hypothetical protein